MPALGLMAGVAACSGNASSSGGRGKTLGDARTVSFAIGTTGSDFVTELSLGAADAAEMLGWRFNRILNTQPTPEAHINAIRTAVTSRADVIVTVDWYQAVVDEIRKSQSPSQHFAIVNSANNLDGLSSLGVPFVGQEPRATGRLMGERIAGALKAKGVTQGAVLVGNPFPGSVNVEDRIGGIAEGLGGATGPYRMVSFPDSAASDSAAAVGLYKAKIAEVADVVAHAVAGGEMSVVPLTKALAELRGKAKDVVIGTWGSSLKAFNLVKSGDVDFALDENLYFQAFMAVMLVWSRIERGMPAVNLSAGHAWVTPETVAEVIKAYEQRKAAAAAYGLS